VATSIYNQAISLRKNGFTNVELSGHDPIQLENIAGYVHWLKEIGFTEVLLLTHGRDLCDISLVKKLNIAGLDDVNIPFYGSHAEVHDVITNVHGSFKETLLGIQNIRKYAPDIQIYFHTLIMKENLRDIPNIIRLFAKFHPVDSEVKLPYIPYAYFAQHSALSYKHLKPHMKPLFDLCSELFGRKFAFIDIPFCILGFYDALIVHSGGPQMADNYSVPDMYKTEKHGVPSYRLYQKLKICKNCHYDSMCIGFIKDYVVRFKMENDPFYIPL
jgi:MoaA/NifB/PqqE/SkfB family radical SAM enzyme